MIDVLGPERRRRRDLHPAMRAIFSNSGTMLNSLSSVLVILWRGRTSNTPVRSSLQQQGAFAATGFSPEMVVMVVMVEQDIVTSEPLAGTRALSGSVGEDAYNRAELQSDSKEIVEHIISVKWRLETLCVARLRSPT